MRIKILYRNFEFCVLGKACLWNRQVTSTLCKSCNLYFSMPLSSAATITRNGIPASVLVGPALCNCHTVLREQRLESGTVAIPYSYCKIIKTLIHDNLAI